MNNDIASDDVFYYHKKLIEELREKREKEKKIFLEKMSNTQNELLNGKNELDKKDEEVTKGIKNIKINLRQLRAVLGLWILLPFAGGALGGAVGSLSWKYKVTTKTYNMKTNESISDDIITYQDKNYEYKIVIKKCSPWEKKIDSTGYTREVLEYEYYERNQNKEYNLDSILQLVKPTYYREEKEMLDSNDTLLEPEIIIMESKIDTSDRRVDKTFAITFGIACFIFISLLISKNQISDLLEDNDIKKIKEELKKCKITKKTITEEYHNLAGRIVKFQEEYQDNDFMNDVDFEINEELLETVKKYVRK